MIQVFLLLLLLGQVPSLSYPLKSYHYIATKKSWHDARQYCNEKYKNIAIFNSTEDIQLLSRPAGFNSSSIWIGLLDDPAHWRNMGNRTNSWVWSSTGKHSRTGYHNFSPLKLPDNYGSNEVCGIISSAIPGAWEDVKCTEKYTFVCFTANGSDISYTLVNISKTWSDAQAFCRQHHTDLVTIEDSATNTQILNLNLKANVWIGLSREPWHWSDGSPLTFNNWQQGQPAGKGNQFCVAEDNVHKWMVDECGDEKPFICLGENSLINKVKVNLESSANLADPDVQTQVLQQLEAEFRVRGFDVSTLRWSIKPQIKK